MRQTVPIIVRGTDSQVPSRETTNWIAYKHKILQTCCSKGSGYKLCSTHLQNFEEALFRFSQLYIKTLLGFCCSVAQSCLTPCDPINFSTPGFPVHHHLLKLAQTHSIGLLMPANHLVLCHLLCSFLQYFPASGFFSNKLTLPIRWPNYWSFSISSSTEHSGLISLRIDCLDLLAVQGTFQSLLHSPGPQFKQINSSAFNLQSSSSICIWLLGKP